MIDSKGGKMNKQRRVLITTTYNEMGIIIDTKAQEVSNDSPELDNNFGDLISRKAAIDAIDKIFPADPMRNDYTQGITCGAALANIYIGQLPSVQPEIIRCEDCRYWEQETFNDGYCTEMDLRMCDADFYCGYAERRTDEE